MGVDWKYIDEKYPSSLDKKSMSEADYRKERTIELYSYLPQTTLEERYQYTDIRDAVVELNYTFFGYIASHRFINNSSVSYEDKFQSALTHFCEIWHKFKFAKKYRTDLSFAVFFKPRISECIERELDQIKYSLRRTLCMKAGEQLGKHWAKVTYEDLKDITLPPDEMESIKAIFGSLYSADLETHAMFIEDSVKFDDFKYYSNRCESITDLLIHEMVVKEADLDDKDILDLAVATEIPYQKLKSLMPAAKEKLHKELMDRIEIQQAFY